MTPLSICPNIPQAIDRNSYLSRNTSFYLLASITVSFLAASSAPTPLYALYRSQWGFSPLTGTIIFAIYAIAVLAALLFVGRLSDHLGRRPVLIAAIAVQVATMILFARAGDVGDLVLARIIQGLATGAAVGAIGAGMIDLNKDRGATANAVAPTLGTATGGMLAGLLVQYFPAPTHLVYAIFAVIFVVQGIGLTLMADTISPAPGALASLKPQFHLPAATRGPMMVALPVLVATWALGGFYASLGPTVIRGMLGMNSPFLGGLALFVLAASGSLAILVLRHRDPRTLMLFGASMLAVGVGLSVRSLPQHALALFLIGTSIAGIGFGTGFQGAIRSTVPLAAAHERAGVLSIVFIVSYLAMGLPAIGAGALLARHGNIIGTAELFGAVVIALALAAVVAGAIRMVLRGPSVPSTLMSHIHELRLQGSGAPVMAPRQNDAPTQDFSGRIDLRQQSGGALEPDLIPRHEREPIAVEHQPAGDQHRSAFDPDLRRLNPIGAEHPFPVGAHRHAARGNDPGKAQQIPGRQILLPSQRMSRVADDDLLIVEEDLLHDVIAGRGLPQRAAYDQIDISLPKRIQQLPIGRLDNPDGRGGIGRQETGQQLR